MQVKKRGEGDLTSQFNCTLICDCMTFSPHQNYKTTEEKSFNFLLQFAKGNVLILKWKIFFLKKSEVYKYRIKYHILILVWTSFKT